MTRGLRQSSPIITIGFVLVLVLMASIALIGLTRMADIHRRMEAVVHEHNVKAELVAEMRNAARERTISLHRMALMRDPFDRDEEYLRFRQMAWVFLRARNALFAMPLSETERQTILASQEMTQVSVPIQERIYELLVEGRHAEADRMLLEEAIPAQNKVFMHFSAFLDHQRRQAQEAAARAREEYREAIYGMVIAGTLAVLLGALIAWVVVRRTRAIEQALSDEKERAEVTLNAVEDGVIATDADGRIQYMNPVAECLTGWPEAEARGQALTTVFRVVNEFARDQVRDPLAGKTLDGRAVGADPHALLLARDGSEYAVEESAAPMRNAAGAVIGYVIAFRDVTRARHLARQLSWQATHDALTGLGNRLEFEAVMEQLLDSARAHNKRHALIYIDLDQFKIVNDTCGHAAGDELLRQLAVVISGRIREGDTVFRLGGDEFAILLNGCPLLRAEAIADEIRQCVEEFRFVWQDKTFTLGTSMGLVPITAESAGIGQVLAAADAACYTAKEKGRNRIQVYEPSDTELALREGEMRWLPRIRQAIEEGRLVLFHQRIAPLRGSGEMHCELLLRMRDEAGALVPPHAFLPAAERYNLMPSVDRWVVRRAVDWIEAHGADAGPMTLNVNLSGQSLTDEKFLSFLVEQVRRVAGGPVRIGFEITETAAIANLGSAMRLIAALKALGCPFALDDFGSGMSSFAYLKNLPVDWIKIDGVFVRDMIADPVDFSMVEAINRIGHVMGIQTVAEFVESELVMAKLRELGVDYAQGYGIHRPEPLPELAPLGLRRSASA